MPKPRADYHSAHYPPLNTPAVTGCIVSGGVAFVHDLMDGLPPAFDGCDVFYADIPWRSGFALFNKRADVADGRTFPAFMDAVWGVIAQGTPTVLVTGLHAGPFLPEPCQLVPLRLNEHDAVAYCFALADIPPVLTAADLLVHLAQRFDRVGDFCCGCGSAARAFVRAGKEFVAADINPQCIGYIAAHAPGWSREAVS